MFELGNIGSYMKSGYNAMEQSVLGVAHGCYSPVDFIGAKIMALFTDTKLFPDGTENWSYTRSLMYIHTSQYD